MWGSVETRINYLVGRQAWEDVLRAQRMRQVQARELRAPCPALYNEQNNKKPPNCKGS